MNLPRQNSAFFALMLVLIFSPAIPSHKYKHKGKKTDHTGGISVYEVPHHGHYAPPVPAYPSTYYPTAFGPPTYEYDFNPSYFPPTPLHPPTLHPPYGVSYVPVCTGNCGDEGGKKSNKKYIKGLKKEEIKLYKGLKDLTKGLWKGYKKGEEEEVVTVHRPIYHPPPPPRLVEVRVPKCKDTVEIPTYVTETLIKTHKVYVTKTRTKTTERHIKEYIVNTEYQTKTATQVISHYAAPETRTVYGPPETVTVYSPPEIVVKTDYQTHYHPTTQYVPHYVTVTISPEPSYKVQAEYLEHATPYHATPPEPSFEVHTEYLKHATPFQATPPEPSFEVHSEFLEHATPYHATEHFPPLSYEEHISYAKRKVDNPTQKSPQPQTSERKTDPGKTGQKKQATTQ